MAKAKDGKLEEKSYKMPDGKILKLGDELFKCPENMFSILAWPFKADRFPRVAYESMRACDVDIRNHVIGNIVLAGGCTMFKGMKERFEKEMKALFSSKLAVIAPPERAVSAWIGGSILTSLSTFDEMWISKDDYEEVGPTIVHNKCF